MNKSPFLDFDKCILSNQLWPDFINKIGIFKAKSAVRQALDLQRMQGSFSTMPVLILETCGTALVNSEVVKNCILCVFVYIGKCIIY